MQLNDYRQASLIDTSEKITEKENEVEVWKERESQSRIKGEGLEEFNKRKQEIFKSFSKYSLLLSL